MHSILWKSSNIRLSRSTSRSLRRLPPVLVGLTLAACGGGGDSASQTPNPPPAAAALTIGGVAAVGAPLVGATVNAKCSAGTPASGTTSATGSYSLSVVGGVLPCVLRASGGTACGAPNTQQLHAWVPGAVASTSARANLTPLTELMAAHTTGGSPAAFFDAVDAAGFARITTATSSAALDAVRNGLPEALRGALGGADPLTAVFQADGSGLDAVLDQFQTALAAAGLSLDAAAARLAGGDAPLPPYLSGPFTGSGEAGDSVVLNGHALPANPVVRFGATTATGASTNAAGTQITVPVPAGLTAGVVDLTVDGVAGAVAYTVVVPPPPGPDAPVISGFSPASGAPGTVITISGTGFASGQVVRLGNTAVTPATLSATSMTLVVPGGLTDGTYKLSVDGVESAASFALSTPVPPPPVSGYTTYPDFYAAAPRAGSSNGAGATADAAQWLVGTYWGRGTSSGTQCTLTVNADGSIASTLAGNTRNAALSGDSGDRWLVADTVGSFSLNAITGSEYIGISGGVGSLVNVQLSGIAGDFCVPMFKSATPVDTGAAAAPFRITATGFTSTDLPAGLVGSYTGWSIGKPLTFPAAAPTTCTLAIAGDGTLSLSNGGGSFTARLDGSEDRSGDGQVSSLQDPGFNTLYNFRADSVSGGVTQRVQVEVRHTVGRTQVTYASGEVVGGSGADSGRACYFPN